MKSHNRALNCCIITVKMFRFVVFVYLVTLKIKATKFNKYMHKIVSSAG
jgi:hypothetical protein